MLDPVGGELPQLVLLPEGSSPRRFSSQKVHLPEGSSPFALVNRFLPVPNHLNHLAVPWCASPGAENTSTSRALAAVLVRRSGHLAVTGLARAPQDQCWAPAGPSDQVKVCWAAGELRLLSWWVLLVPGVAGTAF